MVVFILGCFVGEFIMMVLMWLFKSHKDDVAEQLRENQSKKEGE